MHIHKIPIESIKCTCTIKRHHYKPGLQASIGVTLLKPLVFMCSWYNICYSHCKLVYKGILQPHAETEVHDYCSLRKNLFFSYGFCLPRNTGTCNIAHTLFMFGTVYVPVYTCSSLSQDLSQEGSSDQDTQGHGR